MNSYYDLLGVPPQATEMEIRSAYGRDVLRLQESASDKVAQFRAALDTAFATLVDPTKRSEYDAVLAATTQADVADAADDTDAAFRYARRGGFWFGDCTTRSASRRPAPSHIDSCSSLAGRALSIPTSRRPRQLSSVCRDVPGASSWAKT